MFKIFTKLSHPYYLIKVSGTSIRTNVIMTGYQPTGIPHIGNFFGPINECYRLNQNKETNRIYISIVDMHALTSYIGAKELKQYVYSMAASLLSSGISGANVKMFQQSLIEQHASLAWILMCLCPVNRVQHMPQWKEKMHSLPHDESPNTGLLIYPVLQAADVILYSPNIVPVGDDQVIHLELTRYLRTKLINNFSNVSDSIETYFPIPQLKLCRFPKIHSLRDPSKKMSKSDPDPNSRIELTDFADTIRMKIKKSVTDSETGKITYDVVNRPGLANLINIYVALQDVSHDVALSEIEQLTKIQFKELLSEKLVACIDPIRQKIEELLEDRTEIDRVLEEGHEAAQQKATESMDIIRHHLGVRTATLHTSFSNYHRSKM